VSGRDEVTYKEVVVGSTEGSQDVDLFSLVQNKIVDSARLTHVLIPNKNGALKL